MIGQPLIIQHWSEAAAQIPLPSGQFSSTAKGSFGLCINLSTGAFESCSTSGAGIEAITGLANGSVTFDSAGNGCGVAIEVDSLPLAPFYLDPSLPPPPFPAFVNPVRRVKSQLVDYDPATGIGDRSQTVYTGGTCEGASFNSSGASAVGEQTVHFVVTNGGNRIDVFATRNVAYVSSTDHSNFLGDFSVSGTELRQISQNEQ